MAESLSLIGVWVGRKGAASYRMAHGPNRGDAVLWAFRVADAYAAIPGNERVDVRAFAPGALGPEIVLTDPRLIA
jgi:hypothetical protein